MSVNTNCINKIPTILQIQTTTFTTHQSTVSAIPLDNTIPQISEGQELASITFSPISASSDLRITGTGVFATSVADDATTVALFRDATVDALHAVTAAVSSANNFSTISFEASVGSASTASTTFSTRFGPNTQTTTTSTVNGQSGLQFFNGRTGFVFTIVEYLP